MTDPSSGSSVAELDPVDPIDRVAQLAAGNPNIVTRPGLLAALQEGNATTAQASAINSFMGALDAQRQVRLARMSGTKITLTNQQQVLLDSVGENYSDVQFTHADAVAAQAKAITDAGETPIYDKSGNIIGAQNPSSSSKSSGWFDSVGGFFHHLTHNPVTNVVNKGWNLVDSGLTDAGEAIWKGLQGAGSIPRDNIGSESPGLGGQTAEQANQSISDVTAQNAATMKAMGFDPNNPVSVAAFMADGYSHLDTSDLAKQWDKANPGLFGWTGQQAVIEAEQFAADPQKYIEGVANDPKLTSAQKAGRLSNQAFSDLARQVGGRSSSIGNAVANSVGLDPVKNSTAFAWTSGVTDAAASFILDPTVMAFGMVHAAKVASIGLDGAADGEKIRTIMDPANTSLNAQRVQRGWRSLLDDAKTIRDADLDTDEGKAAAASAYAHARAATPSIVDMLPDLNGARLDPATNTVTVGEPINTMSELADYLASKAHFLRLTRGKAAAESALMPGAMSRFGYRAIKGALAGKIAGHSVEINLGREATVDDLANPSPADLVDEVTGNPITGAADRLATAQESFSALSAKHAAEAAKTEPDADVLADLAQSRDLAGSEVEDARAALDEAKSTRLASQNRAANTAARSGDLLRQARSGSGPIAQWARLKLAGQRLSSFLPRNDVITIGDGDSAEKIYRFGLTFLTKGDAALYGAMWAKGDEGVQKAVVDGIIQQVGHAAGLGTTAAGRDLLSRLPELNAQQYGHIGNESIVDPITGESRDVALHPKQVAEAFYLPSFKELHKSAAKVGVWDKTVGRAFNSTVADTFMGYERLAMLLKPNVAFRNILEGQGNIAIRGKYMDLVRAKALAAEGGVLTPRKQLLQKAISLTGLERLGTLGRAAALRNANPEWVDLVKEFTEGPFAEEFQPTVLGYGQQIPGRATDPLGVEDAQLVTKQGYRAVRYKRTGFGMEDASGAVGAERFQHALQMRIGQFPDLDRAILDAVENPNSDLAPIVDLLKSPGIKPVIDRMVRASQFVDANGIPRRVTTDADKDLSLQQLARLQVADMRYLLSDQSGAINQPLADYIRQNGAAPSTNWITDNLVNTARPKGVLAPQYAALAANGKLGFVSALLDSAGAGYENLVVKPIKRTTTEPAFLMNYGDARMALRGVQKDMVDGGLSEEAAQRAVHDIAVKRAYNATEQMIDDPGLKTQADVVGRNFLMFTRAVQAFIRRWGGLAIEKPEALRRGFLAVEGLHHSGLVYEDPNGNVNFTYPGSDLAMQAMSKLSGLVPGLGAAVTYPISGSLSGQFNMVAPGFDNPARFSLSPMLNVPFHLLENLSGMKDHRELFDEIDTALNGEDSSGKSWYADLVPGALSKFTAAGATDTNSAFASAMTSAIKYLYAADPNGTKGIFPAADATPAQIDTFLGHLKTQVRNQLFLRAAFGEFAPAPPGYPSEELTSDKTAANQTDPLFSASGVRNLDDEYKVLLNDVHGNRAEAQAIFTEMYPSRLVFTTATSKATANGAYLPSTAKAESWINNSRSFIDKYGSLSAYFVPQDNGNFSLAAYHAQLETGLRQKDTPLQFLQAVRVQQAEQQYYAAVDVKKAARAKALAAGEPKEAAQISKNFDGWEQQFYAANPLFAEKQSQEAATQQASRETIIDLGRMIDDQHVPSSVKALVPQIRQMIDTYNVQEQWLGEHSSSGYTDYVARANELTQYQAFMDHIISGDPNLQSLYNGVFKPLNYVTINGG